MSQPHRGSTYSTPRWVKVLGIVVIVLVLVVIVALVTGVGGEHGPGRHLPSGDLGDRPLSSATEDYIPGGDQGDHTLSSVTEHGVQQP